MIYDTLTAANTEKGFFSYFDELIYDENSKRVYLIKGGPGSGKSTFMKKIAKSFDDDGFTVERIHCSSDPDSLDGIKINEKQIVIIDATAPHAYDMTVPGAYESLIDLSKFWDESKLEKNRAEIKRLFSKISASYKPVYNLLRSAGSVDSWILQQLDPYIDYEKINAQIRKIIKQNAVCALDSKPVTTNRFLSAIAKDPIVSYHDTANYMCNEFISIEDSLGIANIFLAKTATYFSKLGYDTVLVHSPLSPERKLEQVLVPQIKLGFVASNHIFSPELDKDKIIKSVNTKSYVNHEFYIRNKNKISFAGKFINDVISKAAEEIDQIKVTHDKLEKYYIDAMDFDKLNRFTQEFIDTIKQ